MMSQKSKNHSVEIEQHPWVRSWAMEEKLNNKDFEVYNNTNTRTTFLPKKSLENPKKRRKNMSTLRNNVTKVKR
jgi:hypothetical protein